MYLRICLHIWCILFVLFVFEDKNESQTSTRIRVGVGVRRKTVYNVLGPEGSSWGQKNIHGSAQHSLSMTSAVLIAKWKFWRPRHHGTMNRKLKVLPVSFILKYNFLHLSLPTSTSFWGYYLELKMFWEAGIWR